MARRATPIDKVDKVEALGFFFGEGVLNACPEVLVELRATCSGPYRKIVDSGGSLTPLIWGALQQNLDDHERPAAEELVCAVEAWAKKWNLALNLDKVDKVDKVGEVGGVALEILGNATSGRYEEFSSLGIPPRWILATEPLPKHLGRALKVTVTAWAPLPDIAADVSPSEYSKRVERELVDQLTRFARGRLQDAWRAAEAAANREREETANLVAQVEILRRGSVEERVRWCALARRICLQEPIPAIQDWIANKFGEYRRDVATVSRWISKQGSLLGLKS